MTSDKITTMSTRVKTSKYDAVDCTTCVSLVYFNTTRPSILWERR